MNSNKRVVDFLNSPLLASEYAARQQYEHHEAVALNAGLKGLAAYIRSRIDSEAEHIRELRERILLCGGVPVTAPSAVNAVASFDGAVRADDSSEATAIADYSRGIAMAVSLGDEASADLLRHILAEEVEHKAGTEAQLKQISAFGLQNWLTTLKE